MNLIYLAKKLALVSWMLVVPVVCAALPGHRNVALALFCQYVDPGQESNVNNVIHAHTRWGNVRFKVAGDDPRDPRGRNFREFANIPDQNAENARQAAANIAVNGPANHASAFIVANGGDAPRTTAQRVTPPFDRALRGQEQDALDPQQYIDGLISCKEHAVITCAPNGVSYLSFDSNTAKWRAKGDRPDWPPTLAGDTVAIITDSFHSICGYSRTTGELLWKKETASNVLASDGIHFYTIRTANWYLQALDPASGAVVWSLRLPPDPEGGFPVFLKVHNGRLFTVNQVVDISRRAIVHTWSVKSSFVTSIGFDSEGNILVGDSVGMVTAYDQRFHQLWRVYAGKEHVVSIAPAGEYILALLYVSQRGSTSAHDKLVLLTRQGKRVWRLDWPSWSEGFTVVGDNLVTIEPGDADGKFQLTSRQLATRNVNWATASGYLFGWPVLCGDTIYVSDGNRLHSFDLRTGREMINSSTLR